MSNADLAVFNAYQQHELTLAQCRPLLPVVRQVADVLIARLSGGGVLYTFGNGGSAADAQHFAAELIGHYRRERRPLPAIALSTDPSVTTCIANDYDFSDVFARQVTALVRPQDVAVGFSTSGTSENVVHGLAAARAAGAYTVLLTGAKGEASARQWDAGIVVPTEATARIQEMHLLILHIISELVDESVADRPNP
jgi:D-sedoheptulose 7-phosphate isomerase